MVPYMFVVYKFSVLEKITILLFERNTPIIKILLKDISKPYKCGLSVFENNYEHFIS